MSDQQPPGYPPQGYQQPPAYPPPPPSATINPTAVVVAVILSVGAIGTAALLTRDRGTPAAPTLTALATPAIRGIPAQPSAGSAPAIQPTPVSPAQAEAADPPEAPSADAALAHRLAGLTGEALIGELWNIEGQTDPSVNFAGLQRNAARFTGRPVLFRGSVLEIRDIPDGGSFLRLGVGHYGNDAIAVFTFETPPETVVAGSRVRVYGRMAGSYSYTSQAGWNITVPRLHAVAVVRDSDVPRRAARAPR